MSLDAALHARLATSALLSGSTGGRRRETESGVACTTSCSTVVKHLQEPSPKKLCFQTHFAKKATSCTPIERRRAAAGGVLLR